MTVPETHIKTILAKRNQAKYLWIHGLSGLIMLVMWALVIKLNIIGLVLPFGMLFGAFVVYLLITRSEAVLYITAIYSFIVGPMLMTVPNIPVGIMVDFFIVLAVGVTLLRIQKHKLKSLFAVPGAVVLLIWVGYNLIQVANPVAASRVAWFYVMRPAVFFPLLYFMGFQFLTTRKEIYRFFAVLAVLFLFTILWGLLQHLNGYFSFEMAFLQKANAIHLVYIQGRWRVFGTLTSPAQYGVAVGMVMISFVVITKFVRTKRWIWLIAIFLAGAAMIYSGTRTAYVIIPWSMMLLVLITRNRNMIITSALAGVLLLGLLTVPTNNYHVNRIQSAFNADEDESFSVREESRKAITPFIISHPFGGGLGSTGVWGMRFSPWTQLAQFAPDSGYIRVAVELGWIGLLIYLSVLLRLYWLMFNSWRIAQERDKWLILAVLVPLSSLLVVEWAQDIIGKMPFNILFWMIAAATIKLGNLSKKES